MSLCLAAAGVALEIAVSTFTLSWTHSVEKTRWEEEWRIAGDRLAVVEARVEATGAGMEPPAEARLANGFYVWRPAHAPVAELVLRRAAQAGDWHLCAGARCAALGAWLGRDADPVRLSAVHGPGGCAPAESGFVDHLDQDRPSLRSTRAASSSAAASGDFRTSVSAAALRR